MATSKEGPKLSLPEEVVAEVQAYLGKMDLNYAGFGVEMTRLAHELGLNYRFGNGEVRRFLCSSSYKGNLLILASAVKDEGLRQKLEDSIKSLSRKHEIEKRVNRRNREPYIFPLPSRGKIGPSDDVLRHNYIRQITED